MNAYHLHHKLTILTFNKIRAVASVLALVAVLFNLGGCEDRQLGENARGVAIQIAHLQNDAELIAGVPTETDTRRINNPLEVFPLFEGQNRFRVFGVGLFPVNKVTPDSHPAQPGIIEGVVAADQLTASVTLLPAPQVARGEMTPEGKMKLNNGLSEIANFKYRIYQKGKIVGIEAHTSNEEPISSEFGDHTLEVKVGEEVTLKIMTTYADFARFVPWEKQVENKGEPFEDEPFEVQVTNEESDTPQGTAGIGTHKVKVRILTCSTSIDVYPRDIRDKNLSTRLDPKRYFGSSLPAVNVGFIPWLAYSGGEQGITIRTRGDYVDYYNEIGERPGRCQPVSADCARYGRCDQYYCDNFFADARQFVQINNTNEQSCVPTVNSSDCTYQTVGMPVVVENGQCRFLYNRLSPFPYPGNPYIAANQSECNLKNDFLATGPNTPDPTAEWRFSEGRERCMCGGVGTLGGGWEEC